MNQSPLASSQVSAALQQVTQRVSCVQTQFTLVCFMILQLSAGVSERLASEKRQRQMNRGETFGHQVNKKLLNISTFLVIYLSFSGLLPF